MDKQTVLLAISIVSSAVKTEIGNRTLTIKERAIICFRAALDDANTWYTSNIDEHFYIGIGALIVHANTEERERIEATLRALNALNAVISGTMIAIDPKDPDAFLPLIPWFNEAKAAPPR